MKRTLRFISALTTACIAVTAFFLFTSAPAIGQNPAQQGWETVQALAPGSTVMIATTIEGRKTYIVEKVDKDFITVSTKHGDKAIARKEIEWLSYIHEPGKNAAGKKLLVGSISVEVAGTSSLIFGIFDAILNANTSNTFHTTMKAAALADVAALPVLGAGIALTVKYRGRMIYWKDSSQVSE